MEQVRSSVKGADGVWRPERLGGDANRLGRMSFAGFIYLLGKYIQQVVTATLKTGTLKYVVTETGFAG